MRFSVAAPLAALGAAIALAGCGGAQGSGGTREIAFFYPGLTGALGDRGEDMRRAAALELDAAGEHAGATRLRLVSGPRADALAAIDALTAVSFARAGTLRVSLAPPERRSVTRPRDQRLAPEVSLVPPESVADAAKRSYAASGVGGAAATAVDSPLSSVGARTRYLSAAHTPDAYPPAGAAFFAKFRDKYGRMPDRWAIYGYEAMGLIVDAIERTEAAGLPVTRENVAAKALAIRDRYGAVGHYDVLPSGQSTLYTFQVRGAGAQRGPSSLIEALR